MEAQNNFSTPENYTVNQPTDSNPCVTTPSEMKNKSSIFSLKIIGGAIIFLFLSLATVYLVYVKPRLMLISHSKTIKNNITTLKTNLKEVKEALKGIFNVITNQQTKETNEKILLRINLEKFLSQLKKINKEKGEVAGVTTNDFSLNSSLLEFVDLLKTSYNRLKTGNNFGKNKSEVLGTQTTLEPEYIAKLREIKEYAKNGDEAVGKTNNSLIELENSMKNVYSNPVSREFNEFLTKMDDTNKKTQRYLDQVKKTTKYYTRIVDVQIKLNPALTSYLSLINSAAGSPSFDLFLDRIKEIETTINEVHRDVLAIPDNEIPEGMNDLHKDNIKVTEILVENVQEVRRSFEEKDAMKFLTSVLNLSQKLEPLITRAISLELSFWQNNNYFRDTDSLIKEYDNYSNELQKIIQKNRVIFFKEG